MDKNALCKAEINETKINQLIAEIVQLQFRIEEVEREKYIDVQCIHAENARLRSEISQLRRHFMERLQGGAVGQVAPHNISNKPHLDKSTIDKGTQTVEANVGPKESPRNEAEK